MLIPGSWFWVLWPMHPTNWHLDVMLRPNALLEAGVFETRYMVSITIEIISIIKCCFLNINSLWFCLAPALERSRLALEANHKQSSALAISKSSPQQINLFLWKFRSFIALNQLKPGQQFFMDREHRFFLLYYNFLRIRVPYSVHHKNEKKTPIIYSFN